MKYYIETERLLLRDILPEDEEAFFAMDSNPIVHTYLGNKPVTTIEQIRNAIALINRQYQDNGIGRWAVIEKSSGNFIGWSGLKFEKETENSLPTYYDLGYRLNPDYWGKGYATESAKAALEYGFTELKLNEIIGKAHIENKASQHVLQKCGLLFVEQIISLERDCYRYRMIKSEWENLVNR